MVEKIETKEICPKCGKKLKKQFWGNKDWLYTCDNCGYYAIMEEEETK